MVGQRSNRIYSISRDKTEYTRYRRLLSSEAMTVDTINKGLLAQASDRVREMEMVYVPMDESDLRKPNSKKLDTLMKVRDLDGELINGYRTINTIAVSEDGKSLSLLETKPFSSKEKEFVSENVFKQELITETSKALRNNNNDLKIVYLLDRGFDDQKMIKGIEEVECQYVLRVSHMDRLVQVGTEEEVMKLCEVPLRQTAMKEYEKLQIKQRVYQDVELKLFSAVIRIKGYRATLIKAELIGRGKKIFSKPMYLLTNLEDSDTEGGVYKAFMAYLKRWKIEGVFKFLKETLGWECFQVQDLKRIKHIIAMTYLVGAYFYEIGQGYMSQGFIEFVAKLGRGKGKIGRKYLVQGIQRLVLTMETLEDFQNLDPPDILKLYEELGHGERAKAILSFINSPLSKNV